MIYVEAGDANAWLLCNNPGICIRKCNIVEYYYYSHIFPDSRAQHCNYATLLAGLSNVLNILGIASRQWYISPILSVRDILGQDVSKYTKLMERHLLNSY